MIYNYFKLAIRVLLRKKFFTFISLFGISFTLMLLMLATSFLETELGNNPPLKNSDEIIMLTTLTLKKEYFDTIPEIDSVMMDGIMRYDTTYKYNSAGSSINRSSFGEYFIDNHLNDIEKTTAQTKIGVGFSFDVFRNNQKMTIDAAYTDHEFWSIFNMEFIEGKGFEKSAVENGENVAVITEEFAKDYFGRDKDVIGEFIELDGRNIKVIGLIKTPSISLRELDNNMFLPTSIRNKENDNSPNDWFGPYVTIYKADKKSSIPAVKSLISGVANRVEIPADYAKDYNIVELVPSTYMERYANRMIYDEDPQKSVKIFLGIITGMLILIVLLPTLNLINLNVSRIMERSAEIGVRKSFGASNHNILMQFIFENIVQTFLGGIIGLGLSFMMIKIINDAQLLENVILGINLKFFGLCVLITLVFGILSGLLPAYKMSKINIVNALKSNRL